MKLAISLLFIFILSEINGEEEEKFVCVKSGRYENPTDDTCNSFYLCSFSLKGELIQTQYSCPEKTLFSPMTATCSKNYTCPRVSRTVRDVVELEKINNIHYRCQDEQTSDYECRRSGRYADLVGSTCKKYYLCSLLRTGTYMKTLFECPEGTFFDPATQKCHLNYECPCQRRMSPDGWISNQENYKQKERNDRMDWSERYKWTELQRWTEHYRWTDIPEKRTTERQTDTTGIKVSTESCIDIGSGKPFICKEEGKFPDRKDVTCTDYYFCSKLLNGVFVKNKLSCTYGSTFDPYLKKCSMKYTCPCQVDSVSTYQPIRTTAPTIKVTKTTTEIIDYTTEPQPTPLDCQIPQTEFICTKEGRYPDRRDSSCNTYFLCEKDDSDKITRKRYRCPRCLTFDPATEKCTDNYVCPCSFTEAPSITTSNTTRVFPISQSTSSSTESASTASRVTKRTKQTTEQPGSTSTRKGSSTTNDCVIPPSNKPFRCTRKGRFPDKRDLSCSSYFLCSALNNGTLIKTKYKCPRKSFFDPSLHRCSSTYECPCSNSPVTTSKLSSSTTPKSSGISSSTTSNEPSNPTENTETTGSKSTTELPGSSSTRKGSSTTNDCIIPPSNKPFRCTRKGRFPDKRDLSCSSYFLCSALNNGTLIKTKYKCPRKSFFDPSLQRCSSTYECPCSNIPVTTSKLSSSTTPKSSGISSSTTSEEPSNPTENTETTDENTKSSSTSATSKSTGKTRTPSSSSSTERISSSSSGITGSTSKTPSTGKTQNTPSRSPSTGSTTSRSSGGSKSTTELPGSSSTRKGSSTTNDCIIPPSNKPFRCKRKGRFPDKRDLSCSSYFLCSALNNGTLIKTKYKCPRKSFFDPSLQRCSSTYECPCSNIPVTTSKLSSSTTPKSSGISSSTTSEESSSTTENTETTDENTKSSSTSATSKSTGKTSSSSTERLSSSSSERTGSTRKTPSTGKTRKTPSTRRTTHVTSPKYSSTTSTNFTRPSSTTKQQTTNPTDISSRTTNSMCDEPPASYRFVCETTGRFADIRDKSCMSYFLCSQLQDGTYVQAKYRCINGLKFNPIKQNCSPFYDCPCDVTTSSTVTSITSSSTVVPDICQPTGKEFVCTSVGRFPKPGDVSCCTYYSCSKSINGTIIQTEFSCPEGTSFDPVFRTCSDSYQCPCHVTESPKYLTTSSDECVIPTEIFECTEPGRFPNRQDVSCCNYFLCSDTGNGTFTKTEYNCPMGKSFDPELKRCSSSYVCPCRITENPETSTMETRSPSTATPKYVTTSKAPTTEFTQPPECDMSINNPEHVCTQRGRFKDNKDITCSNYFLCSKLRNGQFIRTRYSCPRFSYFDPSLGLCTTSYKCPCINTMSSVSMSTGKITKIPGTRAPWRVITKKTTQATTPRNCVPANPAITEFVCSTHGKFINPLDTKCTSYIHCVRKASVLVKTVVNCEGMTVFDVNLQKCTSKAVCEICKE